MRRELLLTLECNGPDITKTHVEMGMDAFAWWLIEKLHAKYPDGEMPKDPGVLTTDLMDIWSEK